MPIGRDINGNIVQAIRLFNAYEVDDAISPAFADETRILRVAAVTDARVAISAAGTPAANGTFMPAGSIDYFSVMGGEKIGVVGTVNVTECR
jgi:hypothetical protein